MLVLAALPEISPAAEHQHARGLLLDIYENLLLAKTLFTRPFCWEFFMPRKHDKSGAAAFRHDVQAFPETIIPDAPFRRLGLSRKRSYTPRDSPTRYSYDSILALPTESVRHLLFNYGTVLDLEPLLAEQPAVLHFYLQHHPNMPAHAAMQR